MTEYAMAVSAVKAMENTLLNRADIEQLINSSGKSAMNNVLSAKRGAGNENISLQDVWNLIKGYAPDCKIIDILLYKNDFHNLKAVLKAVISGKDPKNYYISPTNADLENLDKIILAKDYEKLPLYMRNTAENAYNMLTETLDGEIADSFIDSSALSVILQSAENSKSEFMKKYAELTAGCADIKTAYRCSKMRKTRKFMEIAVCGTPELEKDLLIEQAVKGTDELFRYIENTSYCEAVKLLQESTAKFEKWCDDALMQLAKEWGMKSFGYEPLASYYIAYEAEIKNIRIISVCKECGTENSVISERMRELYV